MEEIIIVIAPDGKTTVEAKGITGPACKDLTAAIEKALGTVEEDKLKSEFNGRKINVENFNTA